MMRRKREKIIEVGQKRIRLRTTYNERREA